MSILINDFKIINNGSQLTINVETDLTYIISSISFWKMNDFKNPASMIDLTDYLSQTNNIENITINAVDIGLTKFEDICFIEITDNIEDSIPVLGITYELSTYYRCLLDYLLEIPLDCSTCNTTKINQMVITINMLIDSTIKALNVGYYTEAIGMINKMKTLCSLSKCENCEPLECTTCNNFIQI